MRASDCPNLSSRVHSDSAEGGNRSLVGRHDVRGAVRPSREIPDGLLLLWRLRPYSFCRCAHLCSRPLAPGRGILCLQDCKGQNIEQVCSRQAWPRHCFVERQYAAHRGKTVSQYRCIPGLTGRPSPPVLRRATKQASAHNDNRVSLAEPCERDELVAVRTDDGERTIGTVGKDVRRPLSQRQKLAHQSKLDAAVWPFARKRMPIRRLADRVEYGCLRGEVDRSSVVGIHQGEVPEFAALIEIRDARHARLQD